MGSHELRTRPATAQEVLRLGSRESANGKAGGACLPFVVAAPALLSGQMAAWLTSEPSVALPVGAAVAIAFGAVLAIAFGQLVRQWRRNVEADIARSEVEVLDVEADAAVKLSADHSSVDPAVLIDIGGGRLLLLKGQWLEDPETYGQPDAQTEDDPPWLNWLPPPHSFPSRRFTLARWPVSGTVLGIEVRGDYLEPREMTQRTELRKLPEAPSQILQGTLEDVDGALAGAERTPSPAA